MGSGSTVAPLSLQWTDGLGEQRKESNYKYMPFQAYPFVRDFPLMTIKSPEGELD